MDLCIYSFGSMWSELLRKEIHPTLFLMHLRLQHEWSELTRTVSDLRASFIWEKAVSESKLYFIFHGFTLPCEICQCSGSSGTSAMTFSWICKLPSSPSGSWHHPVYCGVAVVWSCIGMSAIQVVLGWNSQCSGTCQVPLCKVVQLQGCDRCPHVDMQLG